MLLHTVREIEQQAKGNLNYYGLPINTCDYSSLQRPAESPDAPKPRATGPRPGESRDV